MVEQQVEALCVAVPKAASPTIHMPMWRNWQTQRI